MRKISAPLNIVSVAIGVRLSAHRVDRTSLYCNCADVSVGGLGLTLGSAKLDGFANLATLFTIGSIAVRESWGVIDFAKKLTIQ
ncbi:hypothetical protein IP81_10340 [Novosphingobium sp. AAP83]|nr:hypothetical protein IP81_10340 [Novosphingobium sp. AAP83]